MSTQKVSPAGGEIQSVSSKSGAPAEQITNKNKGFFRQVKRHKYLLLMLVPAVVLTIMFSYLPMTGIVLAFKNFNYQDGIYFSPWSGLDNFKYLFISKKLWPLTRNTMLYNLAFLFLGMVFQVALAILINEAVNKYFKKITQSFIFLPYFISWVVVSAMFQAFFGYEHGIFNNIIEFFGADRINLYSNAGYWPFILVFCNLWKGAGYGSVVYLAAITGLDAEVGEAAEVDGANVWQRIRHITIPSLLPTMIIMFLLGCGNMFRGDFGMFYQLVGSNANILSTTDILDLFVYRALMTNTDIGMSSASGLYQSLLCFVTIMIMNGVVKKIEPDYSLF